MKDIPFEKLLNTLKNLRVAEIYLNGMTLQELSEKKDIPISTLHDTIRGIPNSLLQSDIDEYIYKSKRR